MRKILHYSLIFSTFYCFIISCEQKNNNFVSSTTSVKAPEFLRFDSIFFLQDPEKLNYSLPELNKRFPLLYPFFINNVLSIKDSVQNYNKYTPLLAGFIASPSMKEVFDTVQKVFGDMKPYRQEFQSAFSLLNQHFPEIKTPKVVTFLSQFGPKTFYYEDMLGIGLDLYLGENYKYYTTFEFPAFFKPRLDPQYITSDAMYTILIDHLEDPMRNGCQLVDMMAYYGKIYYALSVLLPDKKEQQYFYYSNEQWKWLQNNEVEIWSFFLVGEWLYSSKFNQYRKFIEDAPTTYGMPAGAPDRVARWVGYQMVKKFMDKNPSISLKQLFAIQSGQEILSQSKYKPEK